MEAEPGPGEVTATGASGNDDDEGMIQPHHFDKNIYTFSAAAGRALQQQTGNIKNLV